MRDAAASRRAAYARQPPRTFFHAEMHPRHRPPGEPTLSASRGQSTISIWSPSSTLPMGPPAKRLGRNMPDACARRHTAEPRISQHRNVLAMRQRLQRGCHLVNLLHPRTLGPAADQHNHIASPDPAPLDGLDRRSLSGEYSRRPPMPVDIRSSISEASIAVLLMTAPSGARLPTGKHTVAVSPRARAFSGDMITSSASMPSCSLSVAATLCAAHFAATSRGTHRASPR